MVVLDTSSTRPLVSCPNKYFISVQSSTREINDDEYMPVDADASPLGVVTHVDSGWPKPPVVTDDGWLGPAVVADDGWLGPAVAADDEDGWWLGPADVSWLGLVKVAG